MQTQIIPKYVNPPKPGGKMGSIKDQQDGFYLVPPSYLGHFQIGQPVNIEFNEKIGQQGSPIRFISSINGLSIAGQQGPVQGGDRPAPIPPSAPATPQGRTDESESIFITGIVGRAMGSGKFGMDDILGLTQRARVAWQNRHTKYPEGPPDDSYGLEPPSGDPYGP